MYFYSYSHTNYIVDPNIHRGTHDTILVSYIHDNNERYHPHNQQYTVEHQQHAQWQYFCHSCDPVSN